MRYIKNTEKYINIPPNLNQLFKNNNTIKANKKQSIGLRESGAISNFDLKILEFLFDVEFATFRQIEEYCKIGNLNDKVYKSLESLIRFRIINKFALVDEENCKEPYPTNALSFYCLSSGAVLVLGNYSSKDVDSWDMSSTKKTSALINKEILATEIYLKVKKECSKSLSYFRCCPKYQLGRDSLKGIFDFGIVQDNEARYYIGEYFDKDEDMISVREKILKFESLLKTQSWKKYYPDSIEEPTLLIYGKTEEDLKNIAKVLSLTTKLEKIRYSTVDKLELELSEKGAFLKYEKDSENFSEVKMIRFKDME